MPLDLTSLNESQVAAVKWDTGPLIVLAGPGSGKTRVLTYRIARLIEESPSARFRVLGVTFTNKAATEMKTRIDGLISQGRDRAHITTFHAFAAEILRQHGSHVGLKPDFSIVSQEGDREAVLTEAIMAIDQQNEDFAPTASRLMPAVNRLLDECVPPEQAEVWLNKQPNGRAVAAIYREYRGRLIATNQLDFGSLIAIAVELLENSPAIARQIQKVYSHVCVDEFQDTNGAQYRLLVQLVPQADPNLFVVADDDQIIYEWNGASPARLQGLIDRFQAATIQLPENFRCRPEVIALANNLIRNNLDRPPGKMPLSARKATVGNVIKVGKFADFQEEAEKLAGAVAALGPGEWPHTAVLARRRKLLELIVEALSVKSVPAHIPVRKSEFESAPFRWLHAILRLANARTDREQLRRLSRAFFQLEGINVEAEEVVARAAVGTGDFLRAWLDTAHERDALERSTRQLLAVARTSILERLDFVALVKAAEDWFPTVRERPIVPSETAFDEFDDEWEIWKALLGEIATHRPLADMDLHAFLQELDLRVKETPAPPNAVRCMTVHASKGLEFRHVFLVGLAEDELPSWAAIKKGADSAEMAEERRNCFVAITRAEETLTLSYSREYFGYRKAPSRFLVEMGVVDK